jgi:HEAT repeat protein
MPWEPCIAYPELEETYQATNDWLLQLSIIAALGELGNPAGFDLLVEALNSETELVKTAAIMALGELGDERAIALLTPLAETEDWQLRSRVAQALGFFKQEAAQAVLEKLCQDASEPVAQIAKAGLA